LRAEAALRRLTSEQTKKEEKEESESESEEDEVVEYISHLRDLIVVSNQKMTTKKQRDEWTMR
jgi:hypothetical protein